MLHGPPPRPFHFNYKQIEPVDDYVYTVSIFGRVVDAMASVLPKWQTRVTEPLFLAADWVQPLVSPIYAGVAEPAMFTIKYGAMLMQVTYAKLMYIILSLGVKSNDPKVAQLIPKQECMMDLGRPTLVSAF